MDTKAFSFTALTLWNSLPEKDTKVPTLLSFCTMRKVELFSIVKKEYLLGWHFFKGKLFELMAMNF